jgi:hypothetical protein
MVYRTDVKDTVQDADDTTPDAAKAYAAMCDRRANAWRKGTPDARSTRGPGVPPALPVNADEAHRQSDERIRGRWTRGR